MEITTTQHLDTLMTYFSEVYRQEVKNEIECWLETLSYCEDDEERTNANLPLVDENDLLKWSLNELYENVQIRCECQDNPMYLTEFDVSAATVQCAACDQKNASKNQFRALVDGVQALFDEFKISYEYTIAQTGTFYFVFANGTKVRVADHGECYCSEDISVDPEGADLDGLRKWLEKKHYQRKRI